MRLIRVLDERGVLCSYRGRWIVVPGYKLRTLTR